MNDFAAIDFETANHHPTSACSIGIVVVRDGVIADEFSHLIKPEPFYFYRKMGFTSQRKDLLEVVDNYMNQNMEFPQKYRSWCIPMYLPANKPGIRI